MADYRRAYVPGGTFFFTLVTERRAPLFRDATARALLGSALRACRHNWPFQMDALVLMDDHLHTLWTLPEGDTRYSARWGYIKKEFTKTWLATQGEEQPRTASRLKQRRRGIWQRRFWEHAIRDEDDYARHFDYVHYNPVKHGYVKRVQDWPYSTFHRYVEQGVYDINWGADLDARQFDGWQTTAME
jgi:putative transposase